MHVIRKKKQAQLVWSLFISTPSRQFVLLRGESSSKQWRRPLLLSPATHDNSCFWRGLIPAAAVRLRVGRAGLPLLQLVCSVFHPPVCLFVISFILSTRSMLGLGES
jgi:hypothetical protein